MSGYTSTIGSWEEKRRIMANLTAKAEIGELTEDELSVAIRIKCDPQGNDDRCESVGAEWILEKPELFARTIKDPAAFMLAHSDIEWTVALFVHSTKVLMTIAPRETRLAFVKELCGCNQYVFWDWVQPALGAEITQAEVAEMITAGIESCKPMGKFGGAANENVAQIFLSDAWKDYNGLVFWDFFTLGKLEQVVKAAAAKAPPAALEIWEALVKRFGTSVAEEIVKIAAEKIEGFENFLDMSPLKQLPIPVRIEVLRKLVVPTRALSFEKLARSILDFAALTLRQMSDTDEIQTLFKTLKPELEKLGASQLWRWRLKAKNVPEFFWPFIREVAEKNSFLTGQLEAGEHKGCSQFRVRHDQDTYVADRYRPFSEKLDMRSPVKAGELVGFHTNGAKWLTRYGKGNIYAVTFTLLKRE